MAIEPVRAAQIAFSEPYVIIEGLTVANDAPYFEVAQLDRPEVRIAVGGAPRTICFIAYAAAGAAGAGGYFRRGDRAVFERGLEAAAGVRQPLLAAAAAHPGYRVLDGHFTAIRRAMAVPRQKRRAPPT